MISKIFNNISGTGGPSETTALGWEGSGAKSREGCDVGGQGLQSASGYQLISS